MTHAQGKQENRMVIALAGRRVDSPKAEAVRFPPANIIRVRNRIKDWFSQHEVQTLVCSAACGADLLALSVAEELGVHYHIVLPFSREQFRATSVVDRGKEWGAPFDTILDKAEGQGRVTILDYAPDNETAYIETNHAILARAISLGTQAAQSIAAILVWDGMSRGEDDVTAAFQKEARQRNMAVAEISTL
jgi:hypothetical protein